MRMVDAWQPIVWTPDEFADAEADLAEGKKEIAEWKDIGNNGELHPSII